LEYQTSPSFHIGELGFEKEKVYFEEAVKRLKETENPLLSF